MVFMQYGGLLSVRNRRVSILQSNPLWGPRRNLVVPLGMIGTALIAVVNLSGPGLQDVFGTAPIPGMFWGIPFAFALGILTMDEIRKAIVRAYPRVRNVLTRARGSFADLCIVNCRQNGLVIPLGCLGFIVSVYRLCSIGSDLSI